ncbi:MAG: inorganic phosphate transporter [Bacteroidetes bacterium]|nr:inorganic phosphate transporter [Bacteroidota bacterium]
MENLYFFVVLALGLLAISDLVVGVANDAVNFLNSAVGSKAASLRVIMIIASAGVLVGSTFSTGMMEIARKGIFNPGMFSFSEVMIIFIAVMVTDIILLDVFNTLGLPTSTTVSIVFELLGASVGVAIVLAGNNPDLPPLSAYINSANVLAIVSGILLSIVVAFTAGSIIQYITRIIFSFNYDGTFRYLGAIWGGIAITAITYFIIIKGAKGSAFMTTGAVEWLMNNSAKLILFSLIGWSAILQLLRSFFRINILKVIVLVGTFALAMAFAGNDLVNFIGVPLAGYEAFKLWTASGADPAALEMSGLAGALRTPPVFLILSGSVMVLALWFSKKARSVTQTEINLSRQDEGIERFESTGFSRLLVRQGVGFSRSLKFILPDRVLNWIDTRFDQTESNRIQKESGSKFDLLRASVNLTVASALIAVGTSYKLPLSTTYVTFMVAMATALADRSWGRESAVYRISGVVTVVLGWFVTALAAFTISFLAALFLQKTGIWGIAILLPLVAGIIVVNFFSHRRREARAATTEKSFALSKATPEDHLNECQNFLISNVILISGLFDKSIIGLIREERKKLRAVRKSVAEMNAEFKRRKDTVHVFLKKTNDDHVEAGAFYVQIFDYLREAGHSMTYLTGPIFSHVENNHTPLSLNQQKELRGLSLEFNEYSNFVIYVLKSGNFDEIKGMISKQTTFLDAIEEVKKKQLSRIKKGDSGTKAGILYLNILNESKNLALHIGNVVKSYRDFSNDMAK